MPKIIFIQADGKEIEASGVAGMTAMETALTFQVPGLDADCGGACASPPVPLYL